MTFTSVLMTILWLVIIPVLAGSAFTLRRKGFITDGMINANHGIRLMGIFMWSWFFGQLLLWCVFQMLAVSEILGQNQFSGIVREYTIAVAVICVIAVVINIIRQVREQTVTGILTGRLMSYRIYEGDKEAEHEPVSGAQKVPDESEHEPASGAQKVSDESEYEPASEAHKGLAASEHEKASGAFNGADADLKAQREVKLEKTILTIMWIVFGTLLILQVILQGAFAYMDADDSYYVSEAVAINSSNKMYNLIPYTGLTTDMDFRHSLEPFPAWLAFISRITGTSVTTMAHVLLPMLLLPLTYGTYALMGSRMLGRKKKNLPIYLVVSELLVMFSLYSTRNPEKFFITRIRQGKSALASLIIPGIILCLFLILDYARKKQRTDIRLWIMLFMLNTAGCLCSTLGALLCAIPVAVVAVIMIFAYRKGWHLIPMIIGCTPCLIFALLYLIKG